MSSYLLSVVGCVVIVFSCLWFPLIAGQTASGCITMNSRNLAATVITVPGFYVVTMDLNIGRMTSIVLDPQLSNGQKLPNLLDTKAEYDREYGGGIEIPTKLVLTINNRTRCDWLQISLKQPASSIPAGRAWGYHLEYAFTTSLSGIYHWITMIHYANNELTKPSDPSDNDMSTLRWIARVRDDLFDTMVFDDTYKQTFPHADQLVSCPSYGPKEVTSCTLKDGSIFMSQKYDVSQSSINHTVFGWAHKTTGLGMWLISPSFEYKNGGPLNQELTTQWTQGYPVNLMQVLAAGHYGAAMGINIPPEQHYEKLFGPFLVYFNNKGNLEASWQNAKKTYLAEKPKWPYSFVDDADYQYRKRRIFGNFRIEDPSFPASTPTNQAGTILFLCQPTAQFGHCQDQGAHYWYLTVSAREGLFFFKDVRAGVYELHAYQEGTMGEYVHPTLITVTKDRFQYITIPDIVYRPVRAGPTLWEIGYPDRTAAEFRHGDEYRQFGLFYRFPQEYPQGVNYYVPSTSYKQTPAQWRKDWNYVQPYICKQDPTTNKQKCDSTLMYIHFDFPTNIPITTVTSTVLRIAIAGSVYSHIAIAVNGVAFSDFRDLKRNDNSVYRDGIYGQYQERSVVIPINRLRQSNNTIRFSLFGSSANDLSGIMYDYIRLEYTTATTQPNPPSTASNRLKFQAIDANDDITEEQDVLVQDDGSVTISSTSIIMIAIIVASVSGVILLIGMATWMYHRHHHQQKAVLDIFNHRTAPSTAGTSSTTSSLESQAEGDAEGAWVQSPLASVNV